MQILKGHISNKPVRSLAFAPDGEHLASSARDYKTFFWDLRAGTYRVADERQSFSVAVSPDGRAVATGRHYGISLWDRETGASQTIGIGTSCGDGIRVAFSPDGRVLAFAGDQVDFRDPATLGPLSRGGVGGENEDATRCLAFTRDGKTLATGHNVRRRQERVVRLWDVATRAVRDTLSGPTATLDALAFRPDGRYLAAAAGTSLWVWDVATREAVVRHQISSQHYKDVAFSPDGRFLLFARNDATVRLWDTATWSEGAAFDWKLGPMISVAFAPDGMRAAAGSGRGKIVVWDVDL